MRLWDVIPLQRMPWQSVWEWRAKLLSTHFCVYPGYNAHCSAKFISLYNIVSSVDDICLSGRSRGMRGAAIVWCRVPSCSTHLQLQQILCCRPLDYQNLSWKCSADCLVDYTASAWADKWSECFYNVYWPVLVFWLFWLTLRRLWRIGRPSCLIVLLFS